MVASSEMQNTSFYFHQIQVARELPKSLILENNTLRLQGSANLEPSILKKLRGHNAPSNSPLIALYVHSI